MKKILSLALAALMLVSAIPVAYAAADPIVCPTHTQGNPVRCSECSAYAYCDTCGACYNVGCDLYPTSTIPEVGTTTITYVGSQESTGSTYEVVVPAAITAGNSDTLSVSGNWKSNETLTVSAPEKITLTYGDQTMDVSVAFDGIAQAGDDFNESSASADVTIGNGTAMFGTWTGVLEYTVELVEA